jgi:hypothetical protein
MLSRNRRAHIVALAAYSVVSIAFTWPLVLHLASHLPGPPGGDTGVYVWNLWVFRHEVLGGHFPLYTTSIFSLDQAANLAHHNYTVFANIVAFPLLPILGVVRTFNFLLIGLFILNAWAMFALARRLTAHGTVAWLAGLLFGFSPTLVARSTAHASLLAAAPLPLFVLCLINLEATAARRWALAGGATLAWATWCDPYYGVYCIVLGAWHFATRFFHVAVERRDGKTIRVPARILEAALVLLLLLTGVIVGSGGFTVSIAGLVVGLQTIYTPILLATATAVARVLLACRPRLTVKPSSNWIGLLHTVPYAAITASVLLSPTLYALLAGVTDGQRVTPRIFWRTSTPGVDFLSLVGPNPNLIWLGNWHDWLAQRSGGFEENVASVTVSALAVLASAVACARFRPSRFWTGLAVLAAAVTLGPFVHVAGANTCIPTPWTLLRYAPVVGAARAPARFAVLVMLAVAVLFALALKALLERYPARRQLVLATVAAALVFELCPAPRPLFSAAVPAVYDRIASDPRNIRVLELPFGVRDGLSSYGNFSAENQFYQTWHHKRLIGGYKSRVSFKRVRAIRQRPILAALMALSEGGTMTASETDRLALLGPRFVERARIGYIVIDRSRASGALVDFAIRVLSLEKIGEAGSRELYRPLPLDEVP